MVSTERAIRLDRVRVHKVTNKTGIVNDMLKAKICGRRSTTEIFKKKTMSHY